MLKHIVMWRFQGQAEGKSKQEHMAWIKEHLLALQPVIPELLSMEIGQDIGVGRDTYDMALVTTFENAETLAFYQNHPAHKAVSAYVGKVRIARASVDYLTD